MLRITISKQEKQDFPLHKLTINPFWGDLLIAEDDRTNRKNNHKRHTFRSKK